MARKEHTDVLGENTLLLERRPRYLGYGKNTDRPEALRPIFSEGLPMCDVRHNLG